MNSILLFITLIFFQPDCSEIDCTNQIKLKSKTETGRSVLFSIDIDSKDDFEYVLFKNCSGVLTELRRSTGSCRLTLSFDEPKLVDCQYRVTVEFKKEESFICRKKSIELDEN